MVNNPPEIMTIGEAATYLRISVSSLYKLAQESRIPCQKVGRQWRFRKESIDRWLEQPKSPLLRKNREYNPDNEKGGQS